MKIKSVCLVVAVIFLAMSSTLAIGAEKLVLNTLDWEPYIGQNLKDRGWVAEVVQEALKRGGYALEMSFKPWARVVEEAKTAVVDGYFPEYFAEDLKTNFLLSDPFPGGPLGFFKRKSDAIAYKSLSDLKPYRIGVVRGYVNTAEFDAAADLKKDEVVDDLTNLKKLLHGRIDLMVADKYVGEYLMRQNMPADFDKIEFISPPLEVKDLYVCISKKTPKAEEKIVAFNSGLKAMLADGSFTQILKKHGF